MTATTDDLLAQASQAEATDVQNAQQIVGEGAVKKEQDGYAATIAANNAAKPPIAPASDDFDEGAVAKGVGSLVADVPGAAYHGVVHAVGEMANSVAHLATLTPAGQMVTQVLGQKKVDATLSDVKASVRAGADAITPDISQKPVSQAISGITQFTTAFVPISAALKADQAASFLARIGTGGLSMGISQAAAFDPSGPRMSDLVESFPALKNPLTGYLKSKPGDSDADGALKNFLEGTLGGTVGDAVIDGAMSVFRGMRSAGSLAESTQAIERAKPTTVTHDTPQPGPTPATVDHESGNIEVHEGEMTDEQLKQFQGLRSHVPTDAELPAALREVPREPGAEDDGGSGANAVEPHPSEGLPHSVFRGSASELEDSHFADSALGHNSDHPSSGLGVFFTSSKEDASRYGPLVTEHNLDIRNPKVLTADTMPGFDSLDDAIRYREELKRQGHDGITYDTREIGGPVQHIAFEPAQVRNAGNYTEMSVKPPVEPQAYEPPSVSTEKAEPTAPAQPAAAQARTGTVKSVADANKLNPPEPGHTRVYRGESPTQGFDDVFDKSKLAAYSNDGAGKHYTSSLEYADYYRDAYNSNRDAVIRYADVLSHALNELSPGEYKLSPHELDRPAMAAKTTADATASEPAGPPVFNPKRAASNMISISPEKAEEFREALAQGWYNKIPGVLDDTHRTIPWESMSDGANLQGLMNAMTDQFGTAVRAASGPAHVSDKMVAQLAKDIGGNVDALRSTFGNLQENGGLAAQITAGYNMMIASARQLEDLAGIARKLMPDTPEGMQSVLDFQKQLEIHASITGMVRQNSTETARALAAHRALKASSDVALSNITELAGTVLGPKAIRKFIEDTGSGTLADINAAADKARGNGFVNVVKEIAQNGMLSGFPTQIANLAGNVSNMLIKTAERYIAGTIGDIRGVLMPDAEHASLRAAVAHTAATVDAVRDSFPLMVKALTTEQDLTAAGRPLSRAIYKDPTGLNGPELTIAQTINITGQVVRYPGRLMGAIDNLNMGVGRQQDLAARIYTQAATEADAKGLLGDARGSYLDSRQAELRANPPVAMSDASTEAGLYQSFQEAAKTRFGAGISDMLNSHPVVKLIVAPFVHRPLNMLRQSIMDYTVLGTLSKTMRDTLAKGNADTDLALARMTIGTGAIVGSYELAANGTSKGAGLGNRNTQSLDGIPNDSINIGDHWYTYSRLDPIGLWLGIGADLHQAVSMYHDRNDPKAQADLATMTRMGIQVIGMGAMDKSFMKSVDQLTQALGSKDPVQATKLFQNFMASNTAKFVPFSGALRGIAQATDPTQRAVGGDGFQNIWDAVKKGLPYLSRDLPPARDVLGRPKPIAAGASAWWNPFSGATANTDQMDQELSKIAVGIKEPPKQIANTVLDAHQYDEVLRNATQTKLFAGGTMNLEEHMREVVKSSTWNRAAEKGDDNGVTAHTQMVQSQIDEAYSYGSAKFVHDHKDFQALLRNQAQIQANHFRPGPGNVPTPTAPTPPVQSATPAPPQQ